jgi:hypothetical protein
MEPIEFHRASLEFKSLHRLGFLSGLALPVTISKVRTESDKGRSPAAGLGWSVVKSIDERESRQECADIFALDASALAVDQPHYGEASRPALYEIFLDDTTDFLWSKRVEVENIFQRQYNWVGERRATIRVLVRQPKRFFGTSPHMKQFSLGLLRY